MGGPLERLTAELGDRSDIRFFRAPGRVNLMGDHTDYQEGFVLPMAVDRECVLGWSATPDRRVRVASRSFEGTVDVAADGSDDPATVLPEWGRLVAGAVRALAELGRPAVGLDGVLASSLPPGAGMSSSAAVEVACALALCEAAGFDLARTALALVCQRAEHLATGVPCGVMDPMAVLHGVAGHALLLDCRSLEVVPVPLPDDLTVLAVHTGVARALGATRTPSGAPPPRAPRPGSACDPCATRRPRRWRATRGPGTW